MTVTPDHLVTTVMVWSRWILAKRTPTADWPDAQMPGLGIPEQSRENRWRVGVWMTQPVNAAVWGHEREVRAIGK